MGHFSSFSIAHIFFTILLVAMFFPVQIERDSSKNSKFIISISIILVALWLMGNFSGFNNSFLSQNDFLEKNSLKYFLSSSIFHLNFEHVLFNSIGLFLFGSYVFQTYGKQVFFYLMLPPFIILPVVSIVLHRTAFGLSGSICALMGFILILDSTRPIKILAILLFKNGIFRIAVGWIILASISYDIVGVIQTIKGYPTHIAHYGHIIGYVYGGMFAYFARAQRINVYIPNNNKRSFNEFLSSYSTNALRNKSGKPLLVLASIILLIGAGGLAATLLHFFNTDYYSVDIIEPQLFKFEIKSAAIDLVKWASAPILLLVASLITFLKYKNAAFIYIFLVMLGITINLYFNFIGLSRISWILILILLTQQIDFNEFSKEKSKI